MKGVVMTLLTCDELKTKTDNADNFKLVFMLGDWHFHAQSVWQDVWQQAPKRKTSPAG